VGVGRRVPPGKPVIQQVGKPAPRCTAAPVLLMVVALLFGFPNSVLGQIQTSAPPQDPLMNLLMSQPRMDFGAPIKPVVTFDPPVIRPARNQSTTWTSTP